MDFNAVNPSWFTLASLASSWYIYDLVRKLLFSGKKLTKTISFLSKIFTQLRKLFGKGSSASWEPHDLIAS